MAEDLDEIFGDGVGLVADAIEAANTTSYRYLLNVVEESGIEIETFENKLIEIMERHGIDVDTLIEKYGSLERAIDQEYKSTEELQNLRDRVLNETISAFRTREEIERDDAIIQSFRDHFYMIDDLIDQYGSLNAVMNKYFDNSSNQKSEGMREEILRRAENILETKHLNERELAIIESCRQHGIEIDELIKKYGSLDSAMSNYFNDGSAWSSKLKDSIMKDAYDMLSTHTESQKKYEKLQKKLLKKHIIILLNMHMQKQIEAKIQNIMTSLLKSYKKLDIIWK